MYKDLKHNEIFSHKLASKVLDSNERPSKLISGHKLKDYHQSALIVGHILGEYLYKKASKKELYERLKIEIKDMSELQFLKVKNEILKDENYKNHSKRYF